jgi:hypothetical protein
MSVLVLCDEAETDLRLAEKSGIVLRTLTHHEQKKLYKFIERVI